MYAMMLLHLICAVHMVYTAYADMPYREPREEAETVESESLFNGGDSTVDGGPVQDRALLEEVNAFRMLSTLTPLHSDPIVKKPRDITIDGTGNHVIVVLQERPGGIENGGLSVIDVANPFQPMVIGETFVDQPTEVLAVGDFAFTCGVQPFAGTGALRIVDVSTLSNPTLVGSANVGGQLFALAVEPSGNRVYCAETGSLGVVAFDTTNKTSPSAISVSSDASGFGAGQVRFDPNRNIVFATDFANRLLKAFDTQSSPPLQLIGQISLPSPQLLVYLTLDIEQHFAFVGEFGGAGDTLIQMVDTSDPANMERVDTFNINEAGTSPSLQALHVHDNELFVSHAEDSGNGKAFLSIIPYSAERLARPRPLFTGRVRNAPKVQIGSFGDGPIDGLAFDGSRIFAPLLDARAQRGALVTAENVRLVTLT